MPVVAGPATSELPDWAPDLYRVAAYIPARTLVGVDDGYGNVRRTFDPTTHPTNYEVQLIVEDACNWALAAIGTPDDLLLGALTGLVARRSAGWVQYSYPDREDDQQHAEKLLAETDAELASLVARNAALTGDDPADPSDDVTPDAWWPTVCDTTYYC